MSPGEKKWDIVGGEVSRFMSRGWKEMVLRNSKEGRLHFTTDLASCLDNVDIVFSAVGTPPDEDGSATCVMCWRCSYVWPIY